MYFFHHWRRTTPGCWTHVKCLYVCSHSEHCVVGKMLVPAAIKWLGTLCSALKSPLWFSAQIGVRGGRELALWDTLKTDTCRSAQWNAGVKKKKKKSKSCYKYISYLYFKYSIYQYETVGDLVLSVNPRMFSGYEVGVTIYFTAFPLKWATTGCSVCTLLCNGMLHKCAEWAAGAVPVVSRQLMQYRQTVIESAASYRPL